MTGYMPLSVYYKLLFDLAHHHKYSFADMQEWIPFEREIYVQMLITFLEKEKNK